jgi:hypothetical protein
MPKAMELQASLKTDSVPFGAPVDFNPYEVSVDPPVLQSQKI